MIDESESSAISQILPGPHELRKYPDYNLLTWRPEGVLDDELLDEIGEWIGAYEEVTLPFERYVDFSRLTMVAVRTSHVFTISRKRAKQLAGAAPAKSALFSGDWVGFGVARLYELMMRDTPIDVHAFRDRAAAAVWLGVPAQILTLEDIPAPAD